MDWTVKHIITDVKESYIYAGVKQFKDGTIVSVSPTFEPVCIIGTGSSFQNISADRVFVHDGDGSKE